MKNSKDFSEANGRQDLVFPANDLGRVAGRTLQQVGPLCKHLIPYRPIHLGEDLCVDQPHASPLVKVLQRSQAIRPLSEERVPALGTALQEPDAPALGQISNRQLQFRSVRIREESDAHRFGFVCQSFLWSDELGGSTSDHFLPQ